MVHMSSGPSPELAPPSPSEVVTVLSRAESSVVVCIHRDLQIFHLPADVDMRFALLHNPCDDPTLAVVGMVFYGVASLIHLTPMPKVVCVRSRWKSLDTSLHVGEILIVKGTYAKGGRTRGISVFSVSSRSDKTLPLNCPAQLTTQAKYLFLPMSDILEHIPDAFPCKACVLGSGDGSVGVEGIPQDVITLNEVVKASVFTCSVSRDGQPPFLCSVPVALPDVWVMVPKKEEVWESWEEEEVKEEEVKEVKEIKEEGEKVKVWKRDYANVDDITSASRPLAATSSHRHHEGSIELKGSGHTRPGGGNLKQTVGKDQEYEDMGGAPDHMGGAPDHLQVPNKAAAVTGYGSTPPLTVGQRGYKGLVGRDDVDSVLDKNSIGPLVGGATAPGSTHTTPAFKKHSYRGYKAGVDPDYEDLDSSTDPLMDTHPPNRHPPMDRVPEEIPEDIPPMRARAVPVELKRSGDSIHGRHCTPHTGHTGEEEEEGEVGKEGEGEEEGKVEGEEEGKEEGKQCRQAEDTMDEYVDMSSGAGDIAVSKGRSLPKPKGWIYMSSDPWNVIDITTEQSNEGFEHCDPSETFEGEYTGLATWNRDST